MKTIVYSTLGLFASLLSAVGFDRAANYVDMLIQGISPAEGDMHMAPALPCTGPCADVLPEHA